MEQTITMFSGKGYIKVTGSAITIKNIQTIFEVCDTAIAGACVQCLINKGLVTGRLMLDWDTTDKVRELVSKDSMIYDTTMLTLIRLVGQATKG